MIEESVPPIEKIPNKPARLRLEFIDGMRGLSAIAIMWYHVYVDVYKYHPQILGNGDDASREKLSNILYGFNILNFGYAAVAVFLVLSGFCLMLPVVNAPDGELKGGKVGFFKRRVQRLFPAYYAAFFAALFLFVGIRLAQPYIPLLSHLQFPQITTGQVLSHLFFVENSSQAWMFTINGPLWSVASEFQIYFLFPFIFLPIRKKFGIFASLLASFLICGLLIQLHRIYSPFSWEYPALVGYFGIGILAAEIAVSVQQKYKSLREALPWGWIAGLGGIGYFALINTIHNADLNFWFNFYLPFVVGAFLIWAANHDSKAAKRPPVIQFLELKPIVFLGGFSYSLYAIHHPILIGLKSVLLKFNLPVRPYFFALLVIETVVAVFLASQFAKVFEYPFLTNKPFDQSWLGKFYSKFSRKKMA